MPAVRLVLPTPPLPFAIATTRRTCHTLHIHRCAHPDPTSGLTGVATPNRTGADAASTTGEAPPSGPAIRHGAPTSNATPGSSPVPPPDEHGDATGDLTACANGDPPPVAAASGHGDAHHGAHPEHKRFATAAAHRAQPRGRQLRRHLAGHMRRSLVLAVTRQRSPHR